MARSARLPRLPLSVRILRAIIRSFSAPLADIAAELHRIADQNDRIIAARRIPRLPTAAEQAAADRDTTPAISDMREEWEIAIDEYKREIGYTEGKA